MNRFIVRDCRRFVGLDRRSGVYRRGFRFWRWFGLNRFRNRRRPDLRDRRKYRTSLGWSCRFGFLRTPLLNQRNRLWFRSVLRRLRLGGLRGFFVWRRSRRRFRLGFLLARLADRRYPGAPCRPMLMVGCGSLLLRRDQIGKWLGRCGIALFGGGCLVPRGLGRGFFSRAGSCNHGCIFFFNLPFSPP